jgi:hypothetical protein
MQPTKDMTPFQRRNAFFYLVRRLYGDDWSLRIATTNTPVPREQIQPILTGTIFPGVRLIERLRRDLAAGVLRLREESAKGKEKCSRS